ncbi:MAG: hypothetical protein WCH39_22545, partial [Schlesneria sp.]
KVLVLLPAEYEPTLPILALNSVTNSLQRFICVNRFRFIMAMTVRAGEYLDLPSGIDFGLRISRC